MWSSSFFATLCLKSPCRNSCLPDYLDHLLGKRNFPQPEKMLLSVWVELLFGFIRSVLCLLLDMIL